MPHWVKSSPTRTAPLASSRDNFKGSLRFPSQVQGKNGKVSSKWKRTVGAFPCPHSPIFPGKERQKWASSQPEICFHQSLESIKFGNLGMQQTAAFNRTCTWEHNLLLQNRAKKGWKKAAGIVSLFLQGQFIQNLQKSSKSSKGGVRQSMRRHNPSEVWGWASEKKWTPKLQVNFGKC